MIQIGWIFKETDVGKWFLYGIGTFLRVGERGLFWVLIYN
jgi:hypothetical protein